MQEALHTQSGVLQLGLPCSPTFPDSYTEHTFVAMEKANLQKIHSLFTNHTVLHFCITA